MPYIRHAGCSAERSASTSALVQASTYRWTASRTAFRSLMSVLMGCASIASARNGWYTLRVYPAAHTAGSCAGSWRSERELSRLALHRDPVELGELLHREADPEPSPPAVLDPA